MRTIQHRQGVGIACVEKVAFYMGLIDHAQILKLAAPLRKSAHGARLQGLATSQPELTHVGAS